MQYKKIFDDSIDRRHSHVLVDPPTSCIELTGPWFSSNRLTEPLR